MANKIVKQTLIDSTNRALIKVVVIADGSGQEANTLLIDVSTLAYAMNANNYLVGSNTANADKRIYRTAINRIYGQAKAANGHFKIQWNGPANTEIITITTGHFEYNFTHEGGGAIPNPDPANSNGDIVISTAGVVATDAMTLLIDLKKDNRDFSAGQHARPADFNYGPYAIV